MILLMIILGVAIATFIIIYINENPATQLSLTEKEKKYLKTISPIKMSVDPDWEPFEHLDAKGRYSGVAADYVKLIEDRLGVDFEIIPTENWSKSLKYSQEGKVMVLPFLNKTKEREKWLIFTEPLIVDDNVIIGRYETPYIDNLQLLKNKIVVLPKGTSVEERFRKDYPNVQIKMAESETKAFEMVSKGEADFTIRSMLVSSYYIRKQGWFDLKVVGKIPTYTNYLSMGISKDEVMLKSIVDQAILSITEQERVDILNKHVPLRVEKTSETKGIVKFLVITIILTLFLLIFSVIQSIRAKKLVRRNEEIQVITSRYEALSELAGTYFWQVDLDGKYTYVSAEVKKVLGYEAKEMLGGLYNSFHYDQVHSCSTYSLNSFIQSDETIQDQEIQQIKKDGTRIWTKIHAMPIVNDKGFVIGYRGSSTDIHKHKLLKEALINTKDEIELAYYQAQIRPHFLYNALNAVTLYCLTEPEKASNLIGDLSFFLRKSFDFKSVKYLVTLEQELELIDAYINIEKVRFRNRLTIKYELDDVPRELLLPPLILQPLVENAIQHGIMKRIEGGTIVIRAINQTDKIRFEVCDDGVGIPLQYIQNLQSVRDEVLKNDTWKSNLVMRFERHGVGLKNIHSRLIKLYKSELIISLNESGGTTVSLDIPINLNEENR